MRAVDIEVEMEVITRVIDVVERDGDGGEVRSYDVVQERDGCQVVRCR